MDITSIAKILEADVWKNAPQETDPGYFRFWQRTAVELQKALREWIPEMYFQDLKSYEDRNIAYSMVVYAASRPCYGRPRTEFTYDFADPAETLDAALRSIGHPMRTVLAPMEQRLREAGRPDLGIRYAPVWHQDILRAVQKKPKILIGLLAAEARLVDAVIDSGVMRQAPRFHRSATLALRSVAGMDMRGLAMRALGLVSEFHSSHSLSAIVLEEEVRDSICSPSV